MSEFERACYKARIGVLDDIAKLGLRYKDEGKPFEAAFVKRLLEMYVASPNHRKEGDENGH